MLEQTMLRFLSAILLLLLGLLPAAADKKQQQSYDLKPDQTADLAADIKLARARQSGENWGLAAGLETLLQRQNVALDQGFWIMRLSGGELCAGELPKMEALTRAVNREFVLDDGRHVRLEIRFAPGPPANIDSVIAGLKLQQLSLLLWRGHPYYLTGITYDERIGRDGTRFFEVKELRLADTFAQQPAAAFQKGRDNPDEIAGILSVAVLPQ